MLLIQTLSLKMKKVLTAYWLSYPADPSFPLGQGVTAHSVEDAYQLLEESGYTLHIEAKYVKIKENVTIDDLDRTNIVPNIGPLIMRGIWYPCLNIGFGASGT